MNNIDEKPSRDDGIDFPSACPLLDVDEKEVADLCCCYVIDDSGNIQSPCHMPFEAICC